MDWIKLNLKSYFERPDPVSEEVQQLKTDWIAENADSREEGVFRDEYLVRIQKAKERHESDPLDPKKLLELAEAYAILEPKDPRVVKICERLCGYGDLFFDKQRQGDTYQLYGRSLFLCNRFEDSLCVLKKAHACYRENGNRTVRRQNNIGLLRVYAALGQSREAAERLEVALTQCEQKDDSMLMYMHAKHALEKTGKARDAEILDDIWYVFLDTHEEEKKQWENYQSMGDNVLRQCKTDDESDTRTFGETLSQMWPQLKRDLERSKPFKILVGVFWVSLVLYIFLMLLHVRRSK